MEKWKLALAYGINGYGGPSDQPDRSSIITVNTVHLNDLPAILPVACNQDKKITAIV